MLAKAPMIKKIEIIKEIYDIVNNLEYKKSVLMDMYGARSSAKEDLEKTYEIGKFGMAFLACGEEFLAIANTRIKEKEKEIEELELKLDEYTIERKDGKND